MARREYVGGAESTTLNGTLALGATTINITDGTNWPTGGTGPFTIDIDYGDPADYEKVLVQSRTGNVLTLASAADRGYDGTTDVAHSSGALVRHVISSIDLDEANAHINNVGAVKHTSAALDTDSVGTTQIAAGAVTSAKLDTNIDIAGTLDVTGVTTLDSTLAVASDLNVNSGAVFADASASRLGIGTATPTDTLDIETGNAAIKITHTAATESPWRMRVGDAGAAAADLIFERSTDSGATWLRVFEMEETGDIRFINDDGTTTTMFWDASTDRLGIGTATPATTLDVSGGADPLMRLTSTKTVVQVDDQLGAIEWYQSDASGGAGVNAKIAAIAADVSGSLQLAFFTGTSGPTMSEQMRLDANGNLGIGTASPAASLHISSATPEIRFTDETPVTDTIASITVGDAGTLALNADTGNAGASTIIQFNIDGSEKGRFTDDGFFKTGSSADGGLKIGNVFTGAYDGIATDGMVQGEYMMISDGGNTFISSGAGSTTYLRGPANSTSDQIRVGATSINIDATTELNVNNRINVAGDVYFNNNALISAEGVSSNIDHIWHEDGGNVWIFNSDTTYKNTVGTGNVRCNSVEFSGGNADYIYHDGTSYDFFSNSDMIGTWIDAGNLYIKQHFIGGRIYLGAADTYTTGANDYIFYDTVNDEFDFVFGGDLATFRRIAEDQMAFYAGGFHWWEALESGGGISIYSDNLTSSGTSKNAVHYDSATGRVYEFTSSLRAKENVERQNLLEGITVLPKIGHSYNVRKEFQLDPDGDDVPLYGPIAEDLARIHPGLVHYDDEGPRGPNDVVMITALWDRVAELERIVYGEEPEPYLPLPAVPPGTAIRPGPGYTRPPAPPGKAEPRPES